MHLNNAGPNYIIEELYSICNVLNWDFFQILTNNIDKLERRFKGKFDAFYALNRNTDDERKELEK